MSGLSALMSAPLEERLAASMSTALEANALVGTMPFLSLKRSARRVKRSFSLLPSFQACQLSSLYP